MPWPSQVFGSSSAGLSSTISSLTTVSSFQQRLFKSVPITQQLEGTVYDRLWDVTCQSPTFSKLL